MSTAFDLKKIWGSQRVPEPDVQALYKAVKVYRKKEAGKLIMTNLVLITTIALIVWIALHSPSEKITTPAGISIIIITIAGYLLFYNQLYPSFRKLNLSQNNKEFLNQLLIIKKKQTYIQKIIIHLYLLFLFTGIGLVMYEPASHMALTYRIIAYTATTGWMLFAWLVLCPRTVKKQNARIDPLIRQFEKLSKQLTEEAAPLSTS